MERFLGYSLKQFVQEAAEQGYTIEQVDVLGSEIPGIARIVRIQEISPQNLYILIAYEKELIINK